MWDDNGMRSSSRQLFSQRFPTIPQSSFSSDTCCACCTTSSIQACQRHARTMSQCYQWLFDISCVTNQSNIPQYSQRTNVFRRLCESCDVAGSVLAEEWESPNLFGRTMCSAEWASPLSCKNGILWRARAEALLRLRGELAMSWHPYSAPQVTCMQCFIWRCNEKPLKTS